MSEEYYPGVANENVNEWGDNDDLQALMHAAADADARDNEEALIKEQDEHVAEEQPQAASSQQNSSGQHKRKRSPVAEKKQPNEFEVKESPKQDFFYKAPEATNSRSGVQRTLDADESGSKHLKVSSGATVVKADHTNVVAAHYNTLEEKGLDERFKSRIVYMRNFNNWIKSMLMNEYLNKAKDGMKHNSPVRVLDMCCGKGGDLFKWRKGNISYLICTDIASVSLEQCESRYNEMLARSSRERNMGREYKAEFIPADCSKVRLRERYADPSIKLDLVSCQFAFHYSFESLPQAECMLRNASECLRPGGYFIGTIPDAYEILARRQKSKSTTFGNSVYQISMQCATNPPPLFGAKYNFHLDGVVDCPEFLVHFPTFEKLAKNYGLQLIRMERFYDFYDRMKSEGSTLMQKMQIFETFPPISGTDLLGTAPTDYEHAESFMKDSKGDDQRIGTLSKSEWEATSLYLTFAFEKVKTTWDSNGKAQYQFK